MVDVAPFSALRYRDLARLDALTAPPYDAIDAVLSRRLRARSTYNVVRLELGAYRPLERDSSGRYAAAAGTYVRWRTESVLALDAEPPSTSMSRPTSTARCTVGSAACSPPCNSSPGRREPSCRTSTSSPARSRTVYGCSRRCPSMPLPSTS